MKVVIYFYIKRLGMFPFKVQLFEGCKSETEPINTKSVLQHVMRYQVLLVAYYKADTKYCCCRATCLSGHIVDFTTHTHTNRLYTIPSIVGGILQSRYQVLLLLCNMFVGSHCRLHYTHINRLYTIPSIVGGILQSRYQVLLLLCNMFVRSHCRLHYTHINRLYTIPSIVGGILQSRYQVLLVAYHKAYWT
jgi:hypothetical protein